MSMEAADDNAVAGPADWVEQPTEQEVEQELSLGNRFGSWKTLASFVFAFVVLAFAINKAHINPSAVWARAQGMNVWLYVLAFIVYYCTFPMRGYRWKLLLQNAYGQTHAEEVEGMHVRGLTEIIFISWFVNCIVPAKLGDLYRAYLAKLWVNISWTKTVGTIVAERIVDLLILASLLTGTAFVMFHNKLGHVSALLILGLGLSIVGVIVLVGMKTFSPHIRGLLPERFVPKYVAFEEGTLDSFKQLPLLIGVTAVIWMFEGFRFQLVFLSLGLHVNYPGPPFLPMVFFALATAVLTTVPFTPGGLGLVEAGLLSIMAYVGLGAQDAAAVVLFDRVLSYLSIAVLGFIVYLLSKRSHFRQPL
jgi:glycosyltransferase 2 family protein